MKAIIPDGVTRTFVLASINNDLWIDANEVLYELCRNNPRHETVSMVIAKLWLIGRSYAAPIERGAGGDHADIIYRKAAEKLIASELDHDLSLLKESARSDSELALKIHKLVMSCLPPKNHHPTSRRSIASKYLHFHRPEQFVMFDSRATSAAAKFVRVNAPKETTGDRQYFVHTMKCAAIQSEITKTFELRLTNRQLDELLLAVADRERLHNSGRR